MCQWAFVLFFDVLNTRKYSVSEMENVNYPHWNKESFCQSKAIKSKKIY